MRRSIPIRIISFLLTAVMMFTTFAVAAHAEGNSGKYVKDVFIAYGESRSDADNWLRKNGWKIVGDLNEGKTSKAAGYHNAVAVLGIKRTDDPTEAITDMAVMNMKGGYSFDDYEGLVKQKKADITEFINTFVPALNEYRDNYNGKGSAGGKKRAQMAHDLLNKFYDGDPEGEYALNDTGKPLGDLLLNKTKTEIGDDAYNALSAEEKRNTADLEQIILESTGPATQIIKQALALATDTAENSWLGRLSGLTGEELVDNIEKYAPEAEGQDLAPSAAMNLLAAHFEDYSKKLAAEWIDVHEDILWYEQYCDEHDLKPKEGELESSNLKPYFEALSKENNELFQKEFKRFNLVNTYYFVVKEIAYSGDWGETLYDFFRPEDKNEDYSERFEYFAPLAAALSDGQRAALEFVTLSTLLKLGGDSDSVMESDFPSVDEVFKNSKNEKLDSISIYSGLNRAIFRKGVALTSKALMQKNMGKDPYDKIWDESGLVSIVSYAGMGIGAVTMITGIINYNVAPKLWKEARHALDVRYDEVGGAKDIIAENTEKYQKALEAGDLAKADSAQSSIKEWTDQLEVWEKDLADAKSYAKSVIRMERSGRWLMGIGGALMILSAVLKGVQIAQYYKRDFTAIPTMIVDEADIVTYSTDSKGNQVKNIEFDQFAYYEVVKCNRQEVGIHTNAQDGVDKYKEWGCGDAADLNADIGKQWLAMYVNRSSAKGSPILADSLKLQKGKEGSKAPSNYNGCLHMFTFENPVKIDDTAYSFRDDNEGMYLFWKGDENALSATASTFSGGNLALVGIGGLALGILGTTLVFLPKLKKKKKEEEGA
ncbi:hypothetical protein [Ruminococcus sp.]|uniref:hypothetical protein n=1 Tax=Ruminococcus sp. TaxID=41978 RepID=UPI00388D3B39